MKVRVRQVSFASANHYAIYEQFEVHIANESPCIILTHDPGQNAMIDVMLYSVCSLIWNIDNVFQRYVISYELIDVNGLRLLQETCSLYNMYAGYYLMFSG
jgi:hypothetical protein